MGLRDSGWSLAMCPDLDSGAIFDSSSLAGRLVSDQPRTLVKAGLCHSTEACGQKPGNFLSLCERRTLYPSCGWILLPPKGQSSYCYVIASTVQMMIMFLERVAHMASWPFG